MKMKIKKMKSENENKDQRKLNESFTVNQSQKI